MGDLSNDPLNGNEYRLLRMIHSQKKPLDLVFSL